MSILVSINCMAYNHEEYISDAIEGFLMQKTNFEYEILIGEDCSTDSTRIIIQEYMNKFPNKIKLITSDNNVGAKRNEKRLQQSSLGKYIALCEGDDYWIDPYKLQKQVDYMEKNSECMMCFHSAEVIQSNGKSSGKYIRPFIRNKICSVEEIILGLGSKFTPTASVIYRKELMDTPPVWFKETSFSDYPIALIVSYYGYAYYIDEVMSVYRTGVIGSATNRITNSKDAKNKLINHNKELIWILEQFNSFSNNKYLKTVNRVIKEREIQILLLEKKIHKINDIKYKSYFKEVGFKNKIKLYFRYYFPRAYSMIVKRVKN